MAENENTWNESRGKIDWCDLSKTEISKEIEDLITSNVNWNESWGKIDWRDLSKEEISKEIEDLIASGANVNKQDRNGWSPLMYCACDGYTDLVEKLLNNGAKINATDENGNTALIYAAWTGHTDTVKKMIASGADVNIQAKDGWTALMVAAYNERTGAVKELIAAKANVRFKNKLGETALNMAEKKGNLIITSVLSQATEEQSEIQKRKDLSNELRVIRKRFACDEMREAVPNVAERLKARRVFVNQLKEKVRE